MAVNNSVSQADVVDGSNVSGGTVGITATTTNTATTTANATTGGASSSINDQIKNILEGYIDPYDQEGAPASEQTGTTPSPAYLTGGLSKDASSEADTAESDAPAALRLPSRVPWR